MRLSFSRSGALIGVPRITYIRGPAVLREAIASSALTAVKTCTPLAFTPELGAAIAGRMLAIRLRALPASQSRQKV